MERAEPRSDALEVITCKAKPSTVAILKGAAKRRGVFTGQVLREALEVYAAMCQRGIVARVTEDSLPNERDNPAGS